VDFRRPAGSGARGSQGRESFDLLGFSHYWGRSRWGGSGFFGHGIGDNPSLKDRSLQ
jgi:hypothetical protein